MAKTDWHLQLWETDWILWGYGPQRTSGFEYINPVKVSIRTESDSVIDIPFVLTQHSSSLPAQEYQRVRKWGWRFKTNDFIDDTGWHLCDSRDEALAEAKEWAREYAETNKNKDNPETFLVATNDIREMGDEVDWIGELLSST